MKQIILILTAIILSISMAVANGPEIQFEKKTHDFGKINEDDQNVTVAFNFKNVGTSALVIHRATASCGCTTPEYPEQPIQPGASGTIKVTYSTVGRPYAFQKSITIYSNDTKNPTTILIIKGDVLPSVNNPELSYPRNMQGLRLSKSQISMLDAKIGSIKTERIDIINTNSTPVRLTFRKIPPHIKVSISSSVLNPKETGFITIKYFASQAKDYGRRDDNFYIVINKDIKASQYNEINVSAYITEDFTRMTTAEKAAAPVAEFSENRPNFGKMAQKQKKTQTITLANKGKAPLYIRKIVPEYDGLKIIPEKTIILPGKSIKMNIEFYSGEFKGNVVQRFTVFTNDPKNSITRLFVMAQVAQ